jgi:uncharacterized RDD family membrane protein YckC
VSAAAPAYVGFWARLGATLIDTVWVLPLVVAWLAIVSGGWRRVTLERVLAWSQSSTEQLLLYGVLALVIVPLWMRLSATPGKRAIGAQIVDARTLAAPSSRQLVIRYLGYLVSTLPLCLGFAWVAFDPRKQGWHDKLAGTVVIRRRTADGAAA